jgi:2-polyprenyl-3-methyl-5-hydroxy-6-metoxy-1,4-benzoquinol methylase
MARHADEVARGERFEFGANWTRFLEHLDEERILEAERSLKTMLGVSSLAGQRFLDVGSGSGLFSLAARRLGATVHSFDYDPKSVACTTELRRRYFADDPDWHVEEGSVLDPAYLASLGQHDIVYSWGVLHHTGHMWEALGNVVPLVREGGLLFIAIYNKQVYWSSFYTRVKKAYVASPTPGKVVVGGAYIAGQILKGALKDVLFLRDPMKRYRDKRLTRGMSTYHDWIDWVGGYPFEVASPEEIFRFFRQRGFTLRELVTVAPGHGCNEYIFVRDGAPGTGGAARLAAAGSANGSSS